MKCSMCESDEAFYMVVCGETLDGGPLCDGCQSSLFKEAADRFVKERADSALAKSASGHVGSVVKGGDA